MQTNPTYFIEQVNFDGVECRHIRPQPYSQYEYAQKVNKKFNVNTVALFKIYPKARPMIAHYDNEVKSIIVQ